MQLTVCLNMIVKNEAHIIRRTLEMLCSKFRFDYWVICDTGSTDATREIIQDFFSQPHVNIAGELHCDEWVNFAHNRTLALNRARGQTDLLLVFDADDDIHGAVTLPTVVTHDEYHLKFGAPNAGGTSYTRTLLINNRKRFQYRSVVHEYISCLEPSPYEHLRVCVLDGDYFVVSGRSGARNLDPDKYLKDALLLEAAHAEALAQGDDLHKRYAFYCANSYRDCGRHEDAIRWYKVTLTQDNWAQEKYVSCLYIYHCYEALGQKEHGFFYLVKALHYDLERAECLHPLVVHYCCENANDVAYGYYRIVQAHYERAQLQSVNEPNSGSKLFLETDKAHFYLPYYMIIVADRVGDRACGVRMYEIIFRKKQRTFSHWHLRNLFFNLRFFLKFVGSVHELANGESVSLPQFVALANEYVRFLRENGGVPSSAFDEIVKDFNYAEWGIHFNPCNATSPLCSAKSSPNFSRSECKRSRAILFYAGYSVVPWNHSSMLRGALGGSERAVAHLSNELCRQGYTVYVSGGVLKDEESVGVKYVGLSDLPELLRTTAFHTVVCSRYVSFLELYGGSASWHRFYVWAHDTHLLSYGCDLSDTAIIEKWSDRIDGCVCQTRWHADEYARQYPTLKSRIRVINNGIDTALFPALGSLGKKVRNRFIYTSRTERGLARILDLWPDILAMMPDATLVISTYVAFPCNDDERRIQARIAELNQMHTGQQEDCIRHLGQLNHEKLYAEMGAAEYWLYPTDWPETSCITAMEMLMSGVICLYYPVAGLTDTMGGCGIQIAPGTEVDALINLVKHGETEQTKQRERGRAYAEGCTWTHRAQQWVKTLKLSEPSKQNESILLFFPIWYNALNLQDYIDGVRTIYGRVIQTSNSVHAIEAIDADPTICTVMFIFEVSNEEIYNHCANINCANGPNGGPNRAAIRLCILNTEPLNLQSRLQNMQMHLTKYDGIPIHDYSLSNIKILNDNGFKNTHHAPYILYDEEQNALKMLNAQTEKTHDFAIISDPMMLERRTKVMTFLMEHGYTVKVITGYNKHERDAQVAYSRVLLNIHGSLCGEESKIFEHIRCDRLLAAGYRILSEESIHLDPDFAKEHEENLKLIPYSAFFEADVIAKCLAALSSSSSSSSSNSRKIIDCFIFYNELELLAYRLQVLDPIVDYFIIVEARQTFVGADKPLHYEENKHDPRFAQFSDKIIHIVADLPHTQMAGNVDTSRDDQWANERFQRNCMSRGIEKIAAHLGDRDAIIVADLDEIPDPTTLHEIKNHHDSLPLGIYRLEQDFYYYNLNSRRNEKWYHCKILTFQKYKELNTSCESIRFFKCDSIAKGGWHLSYFGDSQFIKNKLENFAHQEYNSEQYTDTREIQKRIEGCVDLFNRGTCINEMQRVAICHNEYLPPGYKTHLTAFYTPDAEPVREKKLLQVLTHEYYGSAWKGHFEFSMWLVKHVSPKTIVELGVDYGHSTFCLASPNIGTVYAIDCFEGDAHAGFKNTEPTFARFKTELVQRSLLLSDNIITIKGYFDDVIKTPMFAQCREIDILHIDGLHTYEAVKNDFCKWSLKTSRNAVIILHDVVSYPDTVGRLFNEIEFPKFYFTHSAGLGVVCKSEASLARLLQEMHAANLPCCEFIKTCNYAHASRKKYCFIHSCTFLHNGTAALDCLVDKINASGLIDALDAVFITNVGIPVEETKYNNAFNNANNNGKYILSNYSENEQLYENPTLNKLKQFSVNNPDSYVLYLHTKGNSYLNARQEITDWTNMMLHFLVETHEDCFHALDGAHDTVGCNYGASPAPHYSGNFWWAKTNHIATLPALSEDVPDKMAPEFWLFQNNHTACTLHSSGINHYHEAYPRRRYVRTKRGHRGLVIGFHSNQLCERGTEVALFDYALYNQTLYGNKSIVFYNKNNPNNNARVIARFESHFKCYAYVDFAEIDAVLISEGADYFYSIGQGIDMQLVSACPNCLHDVFQMQPHGERYATVSKHLALSFNRPDVPFVPHIVHFRSECSDNLRELLGIPADATVFGRYGGFNQFDISYVHEAICEFIQTHPTAYFIFANTRAFCDAHAQIMHVGTLYDEADKLKFINTCDAMIHARSDGETFGLSIAEFSIKNKPVITTHSSIPNSDAHIDMLGERAIIYRNKPELIAIFQNIKQIAASRDDWNAYADYNPESVMRQFMEVFISA